MPDRAVAPSRLAGYVRNGSIFCPAVVDVCLPPFVARVQGLWKKLSLALGMSSKREAKVLVVGLDNSGKSTIINHLKPKKVRACEASARLSNQPPGKLLQPCRRTRRRCRHRAVALLCVTTICSLYLWWVFVWLLWTPPCTARRQR